MFIYLSFATAALKHDRSGQGTCAIEAFKKRSRYIRHSQRQKLLQKFEKVFEFLQLPFGMMQIYFIRINFIFVFSRVEVRNGYAAGERDQRYNKGVLHHI